MKRPAWWYDEPEDEPVCECEDGSCGVCLRNDYLESVGADRAMAEMERES